jgi:hypothetical protein
MPISYQIAEGLLIIRVSGHYDILDIARSFDAAVTSPSFEPGLSLLLDWRDSLEMPLTSELPSRWANIASVKSLFSPQVAFVATNPADLERGRMFAAYARSQGFSLEVFTDVDEARRWLSSHKDAEPE